MSVVMALHPRKLLPLLRSRLSKWPVVVLTGARQSGKTTLVRDLLPARGEPSPAYFSLDDPDERLRLSTDPVRRLDHGSRLVILDEVQKQPGLMDSVKLLADRRKGHRFLLLGSSQILLLRQVRETLAGRATLLDLWPLAIVEMCEGEAAPESGLDRIWEEGESALLQMAAEPPEAEVARHWRNVAEYALEWGGYPALEGFSVEDRQVWLRDFRRTYLERDLSDLGQVSDLDQFALSQNLVASRTGGILSYSELSRELGVAVNTIKRYLRFLEISYQIFLLRPLLPTSSARLVKSPKVYWTDPGPARQLSGRIGVEDGHLFETFILDELLRWLSWQTDPPQIHFYRTHAGREVDFVLQSSRRLLAIEAKAARNVTQLDARPLRELLESARIPGMSEDARRLGLVVGRGREVEKLAPHVWAVPDWRLFAPAD